MEWILFVSSLALSVSGFWAWQEASNMLNEAEVLHKKIARKLIRAEELWKELSETEKGQ